MELGKYALIQAPSLWALLPLLLFIVLSMVIPKKGTMIGLAAGVICGIILVMPSISDLLKSVLGALTGSTMIIGLMIMLGTGLGSLMNLAGISKTLVYWIVKKIGVNTRTKAKIVLAISSILICGLLGTLAGGNAIIAPILIPILATLGITPSVVAIMFKTCGEIGLILGPLTGVTLMTMKMTGLSYGQLMLQAVIPFAIFWFIGAWVGCNVVQKRTEGKEYYEIDPSLADLSAIEPTKKESKATLIFMITFAVLLIVGIVTKQGIMYSLIIILLLTILTFFLDGASFKDSMKAEWKGIKSMLIVIPILLLFGVMLDFVTAGDGFTALGNLLGGLANKGGAAAVALVSAVVGGFGIETTAILEIQIIAETFGKLAAAAGLPMGVFAVSILAATRLTSSVYPTSNFMGQMITARSTNTKDAMIANWISAAFAWAFVILYAFIGPMILG